MELIELLNKTQMARDDGLGPRVKSFIFSKTLLLGSPKLPTVTSRAFVPTGHRGF
jgi:hypothetical protein